MNNKQIRDDLARLQDELRLERYKRTMHRTDPEHWEKLKKRLKFKQPVENSDAD